ncbi:tripartite tricarboxylate transporter TctB family protein [Halorussus salinisoli]|uniref:tripartite tricarboxylate transporter TctB family protein n=1 Tax=Halorussus salinisoli TaxID=2558242 RepID=UPI0014853C7C|nr:tripartite tricarboxylate transporter TctB family protein [Halorussus salinisoli]
MTQSASVENEGQNVEQDASGVKSLQPLHQLGVQLIFPLGVLLFAALYVQNTYGRLKLEDLFYPYTIIISLAGLVALVVFYEVRAFVDDERGDGKQMQTGKPEERKSLVSVIYRSQRPLIVAVSSVAYLVLIGIIGFFPASAVTLVGLMRATGVESWRRIAIVTGLLLAGIWVMFVQVLGLQVPQGILGV